MKRTLASLLTLAGLTFSLTALADVAPPPPPTSQPAPAAPSAGGGDTYSNDGYAGRGGMFQLFLQAPPLATDTTQDGRGFGLHAGNVTVGYVGLSGGVGYTLTSLFEIGGAVTFNYTGTDDAWEFLIEPFLKMNFGPTLHLGAINPFALVGIAVGAEGANVQTDFGNGSNTTGIVAFDVDPGVEWLFGGRWGVDFYIPIQIVVPTESGSQATVTVGVGYGLVGYL